MILLGVDLGLRITGAVVAEEGKDRFSLKIKYLKEINTNKIKSLPAKLNFLFSSLEEIINRFEPQVLILEKIYSHYKHPFTLASLAQVKGITLLLAEKKNLNFIEYSPTEVKKAITSYGCASKEQVRKMVAYLSKLDKPLSSEHISDALALVLTHLYHKNDL